MLITDATLITWGETPAIHEDYALHITDGIIDAIGPTEVMLPHYRSARHLSAGGKLVMPGNICAHTHFYGAYARGMAIPGAPPADFPQILRRLWWGLDRALDADSIRASALVCLVDAIKHGTTTLIDHHASPSHIDGSLDIIADAVERAGLRAVLCYEVSDRDGAESIEAGIAENVRFIEAAKARSLVAGTFGLHASMTLSDETLVKCVKALPAGAGFHIHVAEHESDQEDSLDRYNMRVLERLNRFDILGENTIAAHCIHIDDAERDLLARTGTWATHQPRSNMNNGVGAMNLDAMLQRGIRPGLGNDGFSNNMWEEWKAAYLLHKVVHRDPRKANGAEIAAMATVNNARIAERFFPDLRLGELTEGAAADMIFVDYKPFTPLEAGNLPWHILFGFQGSMITTTIVGGELLMHDRQLLTLSEDAVAAEAMALAPAVWARYNEIISKG